MNTTSPPCRTLTAARLDRDADLDRDLRAVAPALHYDAGLPADTAITRARDTFRPGATVRTWWDRASYEIGCHTRNVVIDMRDAALDQDVRPRKHRRLSDHVMIAFHFACDQRDLEAAEQLIVVLEHMLRRPAPEGRPERRLNAQPLVAAHERLWSLRHPEPRDG